MRHGAGSKVWLAALLAVAGMPGVAHAGGFEYAGTGTRGLARGGANMAGANDPMAVMLNPSNLAGPVRGLQLHVSVAGLFNHVCFDRDGTYANDPTLGDGYRASNPAAPDTIYGPFKNYANTPNPTVCNGQRVSPVPEIALSWRLNERVGIGFGIVAPTAAGFVKYGDTRDGHVGTVASTASPTGFLPAPSRYMLTSANLLIVYPQLALGVDVVPGRLRVGAAFASGFSQVAFNAFSQPYGGEDFGSDIYTRIKATDHFIPRATVSVTGTPFRGFDVMGSFTYQGDINAKGQVNVTGAYNAPPGSLSQQDLASQNLTLQGATIKSHQPWQAYLAMRYRSVISDQVSRPRRFNDDIENVRWDIEAVLGYELNSRVKQFDVQLYDPANPPPPADRTLTVYPGLQPLVPSTPPPILHHWKNQVVLRVGGDYAIVPGKFLWSGGFSFDSNGVSPGYAQLDFQPFRRIGLHTGFVVRVGRTDLSFAAVHYFQQTIHQNSLSGCTNWSNGTCGDTPGTDFGVYQIVALQVPAPGTIQNSGTIRSGVTALSLGMTYHFQ